jgi:hypothetical protein
MTFLIPLDFSDAVEFELLPAGVYSAVVEALSVVEAKDEDHFAQIKVDYTITEDGELQGKKISQWLSLSPKSAGFVKQFFDAFGLVPSALELDPEDGATVVSPYLEGSVVLIKVLVQRHYQDRDRKVNKLGAAPVVKSLPEQPAEQRVVTASLPKQQQAPVRRPGARSIS